MLRFVLSVAGMAAAVGLALAAPVTLVKFDEGKNELTVKEGKKGQGAEVVYKLTDATKFVQGGEGGDTDLPRDKALKLMSRPKAAGKLRFEVKTVDAESKELAEVKFPGAKAKKKPAPAPQPAPAPKPVTDPPAE